MRTSIPRFILELSPAHSASRPAAKVDEALAARIDGMLGENAVESVDDAVLAALAVTGDLFSFGLEHRQSLSFGNRQREANCVEYAHLFAHVFNEASQKSGLRATAYVVHSSDARLFGMKVPLRGFQDHNWVLVEERGGAAGEEPQAAPRRLYIDPTMHDAWLGWDIAASVKGEVKVPANPRMSPAEEERPVAAAEQRPSTRPAAVSKGAPREGARSTGAPSTRAR